jgi:hypothetical protein
LEAAAGVTGLIKAALSVREGKIFPQRIFTKLNPDIPFDKLNLRVAIENEAWPSSVEKRLAAVNSFGYGGTNAHAIVAANTKVFFFFCFCFLFLLLFYFIIVYFVLFFIAYIDRRNKQWSSSQRTKA